jgi:hypothetical protein
MLGKIIAGTAVVGALALGSAGIADATTTSTPSRPSTPPQQALSCSFLQQIKPELQAFAGDLNDAATRVQNMETQAKAAGYTKVAKGFAKRAKWVQAREKQVAKKLQNAEARCGSAGSGSTGSGSTGSGSAGSGSTGS